MVEHPVIVYFEDTLNPIKRKVVTWVYLWQLNTIITLANYDNPMPNNDFLHWIGDDEEPDIQKVAQQLIDRGYKQVEDTAQLEGIYLATIADIRRRAFD